jgi:hypothetical protein
MPLETILRQAAALGFQATRTTSATRFHFQVVCRRISRGDGAILVDVSVVRTGLLLWREDG